VSHVPDPLGVGARVVAVGFDPVRQDIAKRVDRLIWKPAERDDEPPTGEDNAA
jgi:hypothetical protein